MAAIRKSDNDLCSYGATSIQEYAIFLLTSRSVRVSVLRETFRLAIAPEGVVLFSPLALHTDVVGYRTERKPKGLQQGMIDGERGLTAEVIGVRSHPDIRLDRKKKEYAHVHHEAEGQ